MSSNFTMHKITNSRTNHQIAIDLYYYYHFKTNISGIQRNFVINFFFNFTFSDDENEESNPPEAKENVSDYDLDFDTYQPIHDFKLTDTSSVMIITPKLSKVHLNDLQV